MENPCRRRRACGGLGVGVSVQLAAGGRLRESTLRGSPILRANLPLSTVGGRPAGQRSSTDSGLGPAGFEIATKFLGTRPFAISMISVFGGQALYDCGGIRCFLPVCCTPLDPPRRNRFPKTHWQALVADLDRTEQRCYLLIDKCVRLSVCRRVFRAGRFSLLAFRTAWLKRFLRQFVFHAPSRASEAPHSGFGLPSGFSLDPAPAVLPNARHPP